MHGYMVPKYWLDAESGRTEWGEGEPLNIPAHVCKEALDARRNKAPTAEDIAEWLAYKLALAVKKSKRA